MIGEWVLSFATQLKFFTETNHPPSEKNPPPGDVVTLIAEACDGLSVIQAFNRQSYFTRITCQVRCCTVLVFLATSSDCLCDSIDPSCTPPTKNHVPTPPRPTPCQYVDDAHRALFATECLNLWLAFFCEYLTLFLDSFGLRFLGGFLRAGNCVNLDTPSGKPSSNQINQIQPKPFNTPGDLYGACLVLAVGSFGIGQWRTLGSANVGLGFSQSVQVGVGGAVVLLLGFVLLRLLRGVWCLGLFLLGGRDVLLSANLSSPTPPPPPSPIPKTTNHTTCNPPPRPAPNPLSQMLVFYTASIRLMAESIGLMGSGEKLGWLANHTPQEGGRLDAPLNKGEKAKKGRPASSVGRSLPPPEVRFLLVRLGLVWLAN